VRWDYVYEGENLNALSVRLGVPACMLMRANGIYSEAWLLPGRRIAVPDRDFCWWDRGSCPAKAIRRKAAERNSEV
jgi:hypothetical protein